jgi:hypothetical protein
VSNLLRKKYLNGASMRNLQAKNTSKGTLIWNLCHCGLDSFQKHLFRIPGNGKRTMLWQDNIMGNAPLNDSKDIKEIHEWLTQCGINKVADISAWDDSGSWRTWDLSGVPNHLQTQKSLLLVALTDCAPVHLLLPDKWGWGKSGFFTVARGYISLQSPQAMIETTTLWKQIWDPLGLPKVNFFCWVLMHRKVLTGENLVKRGFIGPHRCSMCCNALETMDHLFVDCPFTQEVWKISLQGLNATVPKQISVVNLISSWKARYPQEIPSSPTWRRIWQAIPKYICWKLWLARNDQIFNNTPPSPPTVVAKAKALLLETVANHSFKNEITLLPEEKKWIGTFTF